MKKDKIIFYLLESILILFLIFTLFVKNMFNKLLIAIVILVIDIILRKIFRKKSIKSVSKAIQVKQIMILLAIIYIGLFYFVGIFIGYSKSLTILNLKNIINYVIPIILIVYCTEDIREYCLSDEYKFSKSLTLIWTVMIDMIIYANTINIDSLNIFLRMIGYIVFSSISCNLLYNYVSTRYGKEPIIWYRLITILYAYIIPYSTNMYMYMRTFIRMLYPFIIYVIIEYTFAKKDYATVKKQRKNNLVMYSILIVCMTLYVMLISCKFTYGTLVIGSGSMTGTIDKGDAIVYKNTKGKIKVGDIIVFEKENIRVVHRVVEIVKTNGQYKYFTKGDANENEDSGYITDSQLKGKVLFKIKYIGRPTLWINDVFDKK